MWKPEFLTNVAVTSFAAIGILIVLISLLLHAEGFSFKNAASSLYKCWYPQSYPIAHPHHATVEIEGKSEKITYPEMVSFSIVIVTFNESSRANAADLNSKISEKIRSALASHGIAGNETATAYYNVAEKYNYTYEENGRLKSQSFLGYELVHKIKVKTEKSNDTEELFRLLINNGATNIENLQWDLKKETRIQFEKELTVNAMKNANEQIKNMFPESKNITLYSVKPVFTGYPNSDALQLTLKSAVTLTYGVEN